MYWNKRTHKGLIERNLLMIDLGANAELRREEMDNLKVGDIHLDRQYLIVRQGKGQKDRIVDLTTSLADKLRVYIKNRHPNDTIIGLTPTGISDIIRRASQKAGVNLHTHSLRHYFGSQLVDRGVDPETIRRLMGHANLSATQRYMARTDKQRREAIRKLEAPILQDSSDEAQEFHPSVTGEDSFRLERIKAHQRSLVDLVKRWRDELRPTLWRNPQRELGRVGLHSNPQDPEVIWEVTVEGRVHLGYSLEAVSDGEIAVVRDYLSRHLGSSDLIWLMDDTEQGIQKWKALGGQELAMRSELLKAIDESCREATGSLPVSASTGVGPTVWFSNTILAAEVDGVYQDLTYIVDKDPHGNSYQARYGAFLIGVANTSREAQRYRNWHAQLSRRWRKQALVGEIVDLVRQRETVTKALEEAFSKQIADRYVPGRCEGCPDHR